MKLNGRNITRISGSPIRQNNDSGIHWVRHEIVTSRTSVLVREKNVKVNPFLSVGLKAATVREKKRRREERIGFCGSDLSDGCKEEEVEEEDEADSEGTVFLCSLLMLNLVVIFHPTSSRVPNSELAKVLHRPIRSLAFPEESTTGLFLALAIPLEDPYKSISIADFFEATYTLPTNASDEYFWLVNEQRRRRRSLDRATLYQVVENKFITYGYQGHECLLRAICETSEHSLRHNGLIGDILHVIFTQRRSGLRRNHGWLFSSSDNEIILFFTSYLRGEVKGEEGETLALLLPGVISRFEMREGQGPK
ncbi:hypothetical protein WN51_04250 [Melipona quadrifasciata]|uniref:Uncharacterized protein n=1 Tax=Melipona quadrifasciata TaxID=166423 RepID=A0A0M8ZW36_9HYME|nr:hypothetical protein WN51_04250 [Melipona quadrifasciata]